MIVHEQEKRKCKEMNKIACFPPIPGRSSVRLRGRKQRQKCRGGEQKDPRLLLGCEIEAMGEKFEEKRLDMLERKAVHRGNSSAADRSTQNDLESTMAADRCATGLSHSLR